MEALINDPATQNLIFFLFKSHHYDIPNPYQPTYEEEERKRSLLYVNKRISTSSHRHIRCQHPDITAVKVWTSEVQILLFSAYIPPVDIHQTVEEVSIRSTLDEIESTIQQATQATNKPTIIILAGDFNRHHPAWSNHPIHHMFIEHASELVNFFQTWRLQGCLPRGLSTHWSMSQPWKTSVIDLTVTDCPERLINCQLYHDHYGSDHRATYSEWSLHPERNADIKPRRAYQRADWEKIGLIVQRLMEPLPSIISEMVGDFRQVAPVLRHVTAPAAVFDSSIRSSSLWRHFHVLRLTRPVRNAADSAYAEWVDQVGDGVPPFDTTLSLRHLSQVHSMEEAADLLFPDHVLSDPSKSIRRSFLSPLNLRVDEFNQLMMSRLSGSAGGFLPSFPRDLGSLTHTHILFRDLSQL